MNHTRKERTDSVDAAGGMLVTQQVPQSLIEKASVVLLWCLMPSRAMSPKNCQSVLRGLEGCSPSLDHCTLFKMIIMAIMIATLIEIEIF